MVCKGQMHNNGGKAGESGCRPFFVECTLGDW